VVLGSGPYYATAGLEYEVAERQYAVFLWMRVSVEHILDFIRSHLALQASHLALWRLGRSWAAEQHCRAELQVQRYACAAPRRYWRSLPCLRVCLSVLMRTKLQTHSRCYLLQPRAPGWCHHISGGHLAPALDGGFNGGFGTWDCSLECTHVIVAARTRVAFGIFPDVLPLVAVEAEWPPPERVLVRSTSASGVWSVPDIVWVVKARTQAAVLVTPNLSQICDYVLCAP
jgi:hypothetical protein